MEKIKELWLFVRDLWKIGKTGIALFLISIFVLIYGYVAFDFELTNGWKGHVSFQNVMKDMSAFVPVGAALVAMIIGGIDIIMLLSDWYLVRLEKRIQAAAETAKAEGIAEGKVEGIAEGKVEGIAEGEAKVYREITEWDRRRKEAEGRGEDFTEQPPAPPQN